MSIEPWVLFVVAKALYVFAKSPKVRPVVVMSLAVVRVAEMMMVDLVIGRFVGVGSDQMA